MVMKMLSTRCFRKAIFPFLLTVIIMWALWGEINIYVPLSNPDWHAFYDQSWLYITRFLIYYYILYITIYYMYLMVIVWSKHQKWIYLIKIYLPGNVKDKKLAGYFLLYDFLFKFSEFSKKLEFVTQSHPTSFFLASLWN